jgi:hypothetical protein
MYGKKRIVITNVGNIVLAGKSKNSSGGSWIPIGVMVERDNEVIGKFLLPEFKFNRRLSDDVSERKTFSNKKELRNYIKTLYKEDLEL